MRAILVLAFAFLALPSQAKLISGRVVHVADGDTVTGPNANKMQHKVRLAGIDAPEKSQAYGESSQESLAELVANRTVIVDTDKQDRYGRRVGKVLVNGKDVNVEQIRGGLAWFYRLHEQELSDADRQSYDRAEGGARDYRRGLWADPRPVPPWEFRAGGRRR
ncbi:MAG: thermonuclease family protein [Hylemonella sp.]